MKRLVLMASLLVATTGATACKTSDLTEGGAKVAASRNPPPPGCKSLGYITGKGGGTFGGGFVSNEDLIEYAMNDLRNKAAELGANLVQHDPPTMGQGDGTTTSVTITGTAYACPSAGGAQTSASVRLVPQRL